MVICRLQSNGNTNGVRKFHDQDSTGFQPARKKFLGMDLAVIPAQGYMHQLKTVWKDLVMIFTKTWTDNFGPMNYRGEE